ncbi:MAG: hypothetical protein NC094_10720 [Bacteroidales bacterium]|nr:hypothetical protein [Lachnoclostridium sp.]MCM1465879.1 hypothetical protein [Bacteroidales bacterium]
MILPAQNASQLALPCPHKAWERFVRHYTEPWLENQMSAAQPLDFRRTWYNDSAGAECKSACAALPSQSMGTLCEALYEKPLLEK